MTELDFSGVKLVQHICRLLSSVFDCSHPWRRLEEVFGDAFLVTDQEIITHGEVPLGSSLVPVVILVPGVEALIILIF